MSLTLRRTRLSVLVPWLSLAAALVAVRPAAAQTYRLPSYAGNVGLPSPVVFGAFQDSRGYLWLATEGGACRYDGVRCQAFGPRDGLVDPVTRSIFEDREGAIWITTEAGVSRWDGRRFTNFTRREGLPHDSVYCGLAARDGTVWLGTADGLARWDGRAFTTFGRREGLPAGRIWRLLEDPSGALWLGLRGGGLARFEAGRFRAWGRAEGLPSGDVFGLAREADGTLWLGTSGGLARFDGRAFQVFTRAQGLPADMVGTTTFDTQGRLWFTTFGGGLVCRAGGAFRVYDRRHGLPENYLTVVIADREGNLWVGTRGSGAFRFSGEAFANYPAASALVEGRVTGLARTTDGRLFASSMEGGLASLDAAGAVRRHGREEGLDEKAVWSILADGSGGLWAAGYPRLYHFDGRRFESFGPEVTGTRERITTMAADAQGRVWFGSYTATGNGLIVYESGRFRRYAAADGFHLDEVNGLAADGAGNLWIAAFGGLTRFDGTGFQAFGAAQGLPSRNALAVHSDPGGRLWVGTDDGLCLFAEGRCARVYTTADGLPANGIHALATHQGRLWVGTSAGVAWLEGERFHAFGEHDGLLDADVSPGSFLSDADGALWFGTRAAAVRYRAGAEWTVPMVPRVHLTGLHAGGQPRDLAAPGPLPREAGTLFFEYVGLAFRDEGSVAYRYRLEGLEDEWSAPTAARSARYTNLAPGRYRFLVSARARDTAWSEPAALALEIKPAWWQSSLARSGFALGLVGLALGGHRLRLRGHLQRERARLLALQRAHDERLGQMSELLESVRRINAQSALTSVLQAVAEEAARLVGGEPGGIGLVEGEEVVFRRVWSGECWEETRLSQALGEGVAGRVAQTAQATVVNDPRSTAEAAQREAYYAHGWMDVPILTREGRVAGVLEVRRRAGAPPFGEADRRAVEALSSQAGVAIEKAALLDQLAAQKGELEVKNLVIAESMRELGELYRHEVEVSRALSDLDRMKSDFLVLTSHEMRTPLTVIKGYSEAWLNGLMGPVEGAQRRSLEACQRMVDRMVKAFGDIVEMLRIGETGPRLDARPLELSGVVHRVRRDVAPFLEARKQELVVDAPELVVEADEAKLELVLLNVLQNAIKFTPDGGRIAVRVEADGQGVHLAVRDEGVGIASAEIERIFDRFYTGPDTATHTSGTYSFMARGPGLGLSIARAYVEAHGGTLRAESDGLGLGACFHLWLPTVVPEERRPRAAATSR